METKNSMSKRLWSSGGIVLLLLLTQIAVLLVSWGSLHQISVFCTGPLDGQYSEIFGSIHIGFLLLLAVGIGSFFVKKLRWVYIPLALLGFALLPVQYHFVEQGLLSCDFP
ncbi:hypothetical protein [Parasphingorhabdus sp. NYA22]